MSVGRFGIKRRSSNPNRPISPSGLFEKVASGESFLFEISYSSVGRVLFVSRLSHLGCTIMATASETKDESSPQFGFP